MVLHTFPGPEAPAEAFTAPQPAERLLPGAACALVPISAAPDSPQAARNVVCKTSASGI
jgi:hypothetical protein